MLLIVIIPFGLNIISYSSECAFIYLGYSFLLYVNMTCICLLFILFIGNANIAIILYILLFIPGIFCITYDYLGKDEKD